jgi:hypothetical protein
MLLQPTEWLCKNPAYSRLPQHYVTPDVQHKHQHTPLTWHPAVASQVLTLPARCIGQVIAYAAIVQQLMHAAIDCPLCMLPDA